MTRVRLFPFFLALVLSFSAFAGESTRADVSLGWQGESGGFIIRWTDADIVAARTERPAETVFSAKQAVENEVRTAYGAEPPFRSYSRFMRLLSVVGPYLSMAETVLYSNPGTYIEERFRVVDLRAPSKRVELADLFADRVLVEALLRDAVVRRALGERAVNERPKTAGELAALLYARSGQPRQGEIFFPEDWLSSFAFHHVDGERVAVRVGLPFMSGMREESVRQLGLWLPRPARLGPSLDAAAERRAGFLMRDTKPAPRQAQTRITIIP